MRRAFEVDVLTCPRCGGRLRLVALIEASAVARRILTHLGLTKARYHDWVKRQAADRPPVAWGVDGILPVERAAVKVYALAHPQDGYRRLSWQMIDDDVAYLSPSSVYRILGEADLLYRWKRSASRGAVRWRDSSSSRQSISSGPRRSRRPARI